MKEFVISEAKAETAVLVGLITKDQDEAKTKEYLDELEFLADTLGDRVRLPMWVQVSSRRSRLILNSAKTPTTTGSFGRLRMLRQAQQPWRARQSQPFGRLRDRWNHGLWVW